MKHIYASALVVLLAGCHFDKLFSGGKTPLSHGTPVGLAFNPSRPAQARAGQPITPAIRVAVDAGASQPIGVHDSVTVTGLPAGSHSVTLGGVAGNCTVSGGLSRNTNVSAGDTARVPFSVSCPTPPPTTGDLTVTTTTTGG